MKKTSAGRSIRCPKKSFFTCETFIHHYLPWSSRLWGQPWADRPVQLHSSCSSGWSANTRGGKPSSVRPGTEQDGSINQHGRGYWLLAAGRRWEGFVQVHRVRRAAVDGGSVLGRYRVWSHSVEGSRHSMLYAGTQWLEHLVCPNEAWSTMCFVLMQKAN